MTVASTAASVVCNITLIIDLVRTKDFKKYGEPSAARPLLLLHLSNHADFEARLAGSGLTEKQRSLVIAVMLFLCYVGLGSLCFSFLIPELSCSSLASARLSISLH